MSNSKLNSYLSPHMHKMLASHNAKVVAIGHFIYMYIYSTVYILMHTHIAALQKVVSKWQHQ